MKNWNPILSKDSKMPQDGQLVEVETKNELILVLTYRDDGDRQYFETELGKRIPAFSGRFTHWKEIKNA